MEFEKRRNRPVKYNRELMATTLEVMQKVKQIRMKREARHFAKRFVCCGGKKIFVWLLLRCADKFDHRMLGNKARQRQTELKELAQNIDMIVSPLAVSAREKIAVPTQSKTSIKKGSSHSNANAMDE